MLRNLIQRIMDHSNFRSLAKYDEAELIVTESITFDIDK